MEIPGSIDTISQEALEYIEKDGGCIGGGKD
jgi:hypothetical protein